MTKERRRYFRINESLGITYQVLEVPGGKSAQGAPDTPLGRIREQDHRIESLLEEVALTDPLVAELVGLLNQKLNRAIDQVMPGHKPADRVSRQVKEANISACGVAFTESAPIPVGTLLRLELTLLPEETRLGLRGRVVSCDKVTGNSHYWRIDFCDFSERTQEQLIQHIVKRQGAQLKKFRTE